MFRTSIIFFFLFMKFNLFAAALTYNEAVKLVRESNFDEFMESFSRN